MLVRSNGNFVFPLELGPHASGRARRYKYKWRVESNVIHNVHANMIIEMNPFLFRSCKAMSVYTMVPKICPASVLVLETLMEARIVF
jgi:hypothetical protein